MAILDYGARMTIKTLAQKGVSNREVARMLSVSEGSVRYHLKRIEADSIDGRAKQQQLAAHYAEAIEVWRNSFDPDDPINLTLLHEWLVREHDYAGSLRSVQRYWSRVYPAPRLRARRRVETPPGAQSQVDWAHYPKLIIRGEKTDLLAFRMVLSHSRYPAIVWSHRKDQLSWHRCHNEAFRRVGGVTATVRVDNEKTAVSRGAGAWGTINTAYRRYAQMMRFHVDACQVRQPQAKGKVERSIRTQRFGSDPYNHCWQDLEELQAWTDEQVRESTERRLCPITGTSVYAAWQDERSLLTPIPDPLYEPFDHVATRRVSIDGLVSFEGRQYSVPFPFDGSLVEVQGCAETVQVLSGGCIVAVHPRHTTYRLVIDERHYEGASTDRVRAPQPLGRMGRRMMELADEPVINRSIDYYHQLAEVAR